MDFILQLGANEDKSRNVLAANMSSESSLQQRCKMKAEGYRYKKLGIIYGDTNLKCRLFKH
jgi:hypothetical protein